MRRLTRVVCALALSFLSLPLSHAFSAADLKTADEYYRQKSYQLAQAEYEKFLNDKSNGALPREVTFKWSDCVVKGKDESRMAEAEKNLAELIASKDQDRWWAEANESSALHWIEKDQWSHQEDIKKQLDAARNYWAGSSDLELARPSFIRISFALGDFISAHWGWAYNDLTPVILDGGRKQIARMPPQPAVGMVYIYKEILKVAKSDEDKAKAHYSLGMIYMQSYYSDPKLKESTAEEFKTVINSFPQSEWADDAYYQMGMFYESQNELVKAVENYRAFLVHYTEGESQWVDNIRRQLEQLTNPSLQVSVSNVFVPDSEIQFALNWRNLKEADIKIYKIDLTAELKLNADENQNGYGSYQELLRSMVEKRGRLGELPVELSWKIKLKDEGKYEQYGENKGLAEWRKDGDAKDVDPKTGLLPPGAYLIVANAGGTHSYDLIMVSDLAVVSKMSRGAALFYAVDAKTGKPTANAEIKFVYSYYDAQGHTTWEEGEGKTDDHGLFKAVLKSPDQRHYYGQHALFAAANAGGHQAIVQNNYYNYSGNNKGEWWLYAFSDRPAYRPSEEVSWKAVLRQYNDASFVTPAGKSVKARLYDAQGNQVKEGVYTVNDYGSISDKLTLDEKAVLGEYRIEVYDNATQNHLASATLFRLEEYKLPEFEVTIKPQPKDDKTTGYRLGDTVKVEVDAHYYFGGPVADAQVEYLVYQNQYYHSYVPERRYPWYYEDIYGRNYNNGYNGNLIKQEKIKTDAQGKAQFMFETPKDSSTDLQYHVEVRVVDQSRREIRSTNDIKVTKNAFFVYLEPKQNLYRPGDKAEVAIKVMTANDEPMSIDGKVTVLRNTWREPVFAADKRVTTPGGYDGQEILTKFVKTNERGEAIFEFEPNGDGYYAVEFTGFDDGREVKGQANVFVCANASKEIGYKYGGLQIISEKDTYSVGETARVMLVSERPDTWILLTAEADDLYDTQVLHLDGSVKLVEMPVTGEFTPNVFLNAVSADHYQMKSASMSLIVPPAEKFLDVKITSDKAVYNPQEEGTFEIAVTDKDGKPVSAELSLGLTDAAVYYIQSELAPDIRQFFYGDKRQPAVQMQTSLYQRSYLRLVRSDNNELLSDDEADRRKRKDAPADISAVNAKGSLEGYQISGYDQGRGGAKEDRLVAKQVMAAAAPMSREEEKANHADYRMAGDKLEVAAKKSAEAFMDQDASGGMAEAHMRTDFRSTVIWQPAIVTDANGKTVVKTKFPDSLTTWRATARAVTPNTAIGTITHEVKSNKDVQIRLQAPRFFTERDDAVVSAIIDNLTDHDITVSPTIKADGLTVTGLYRDHQFVKGEVAPIRVPAHGQAREDWTVYAEKAGTAVITVSALSKQASDAMQRSYVVIPHGIEKFVAKALVLKTADSQEQSKELTLTIPKERIKESTHLQINLSPSMAANLLDALPYLADYPYGCVEQTMSRFLPAVIVAKAMRDLDISSQEVESYISDVLEPRNDPQGHPQRRHDPTYSKLNAITKDSIKRLNDFQHSDGGWGWWKDGDSDRFMTAYVVWGLSLAREAGIDVNGSVVSRGVDYLQKQLVEEENAPDMLAWMLHALAQADSSSKFEDKQRDRLWEMRDKLNPYTRALFALGEQRRKNYDRAVVLAQNLINGVSQDKDNATAHWGEAGINYRWSEGGVEATSFAVKALSTIIAPMNSIQPARDYIDPAVKWLTLNRRGASWKNTRDTAIAILGLTDYLKANNELNPYYGYQVSVNGKMVREGRVDTTNVFSFGRIIDVPADQLQDGDNVVKIVMNGRGALYASAYLKYFTLEEGIKAAGNEIFVERKYYKQSVKETLLNGYSNDWTPLKEGDELKSGDRVRVDVILEAKNNYEYLIAEDYKPAGLEAVELKSGSGEAIALDRDGRETNDRTYLYQEFRDQKAAFFIPHLKQGKHLLRYELRAEVPGEFHAMPNQSHAMYVPEIRANSDEMKVKVSD